MSTLAEKLQNILSAANNATGKNDTNLTDGVRSLIDNAQKPQLNAPTIELNGNNLTITNPATNGNFSSKFKIFVNGTQKSEQAETTINLKEYFTEEGTYNLAVKCAGMYFNDSGFSNTVSYTYSKFTPPPKGALITLNLDGTNRTYRVLKINDTIAEIMAMFEVNTSIQFNSSGSNKYAGGTLDNYLNSTWYGTLTSTAKAAIVDKTFRQDSWYWGKSGNPVYSGYYGTSNPGKNPYTVSLGSKTYGSSINRHVYALSVQDVIDYVTDTSITDGKLQNYNIWKMFYNKTSQPSPYYVHWLRSASTGYSDSAFFVGGDVGRLTDYNVTINSACRPALQIDLSKIAFTVQ